jgi:hypothetical protein
VGFLKQDTRSGNAQTTLGWERKRFFFTILRNIAQYCAIFNEITNSESIENNDIETLITSRRSCIRGRRESTKEEAKASYVAI